MGITTSRLPGELESNRDYQMAETTKPARTCVHRKNNE